MLSNKVARQFHEQSGAAALDSFALRSGGGSDGYDACEFPSVVGVPFFGLQVAGWCAIRTKNNRKEHGVLVIAHQVPSPVPRIESPINPLAVARETRCRIPIPGPLQARLH